MDRFSASSSSPFELCHLANANAIRKSKIETRIIAQRSVVCQGLAEASGLRLQLYEIRLSASLCAAAAALQLCLYLYTQHGASKGVGYMKLVGSNLYLGIFIYQAVDL